MLQPIISRKKEFALLTLTILLFLFLVDFALSVLREDIPKYGWQPEANHTDTIQIRDTKDSFRNITITYYDHGFKRWGNVSTNKTKMLIIGDSFTEMNFVSNGEEWYAYLEKGHDDLELFVYGSGGYGSLQEYMVLSDYIEIIKPDIILWQFFFNDFLNNVHEFDVKEYPLAGHGYRPYLESNKAVYRYISPQWLRGKSAIFDLILDVQDKKRWEAEYINKVDFYESIYGKKFWEKDFAESRFWDGNFKKSYDVTKSILLMARKKAANASFYLFSADDKLQKYEMQISKEANITYILGTPNHLKGKQEEGYDITVYNDAHWNLAGNKFVGEFLADYFEGKI